jgi:hypothetical protein
MCQVNVGKFHHKRNFAVKLADIMLSTNERNSKPPNYSVIYHHIENKQRNPPTLTFVFMNGQR